jgi:hypothetical protein
MLFTLLIFKMDINPAELENMVSLVNKLDTPGLFLVVVGLGIRSVFKELAKVIKETIDIFRGILDESKQTNTILKEFVESNN